MRRPDPLPWKLPVKRGGPGANPGSR